MLKSEEKNVKSIHNAFYYAMYSYCKQWIKLSYVIRELFTVVLPHVHTHADLISPCIIYTFTHSTSMAIYLYFCTYW